MGLVDQLDSAMDRANSSFSSIDAERCRWEDLRSQISSDLQSLQNTYLNIITNPAIDLKNKVIADTEHYFLAEEKLKKSHQVALDEINGRLRQEQEKLAKTFSEIAALKSTTMNKDAEIARLEKEVQLAEADLFRAATKFSTPNRK